VTNFQTLVINLVTRADRRTSMSSRLEAKGLSYEFIPAVEPERALSNETRYLTETANAVWLSHRKCLEKASSSNNPTLILEDDAILNFETSQIEKIVATMTALGLDFVQVGYLRINLGESVSIQLRNWYGFFTRHAIAGDFFKLFGFKEVARAKSQNWRSSLPSNFVVNDVRFGAHCYLVSPKFAEQILALNRPAFLPADDFYVAISRAKSFKMIRIKKSLSEQDASASSFSKRFLLS
jgi:GR25 family glycosyltransferase involved in LPS biosynthesis